MKQIARWLLFAACLLGGPALAGETFFVTDQVLANLYATRDAREPIGRLPTGTRLEILRKAEGYAQVRLPGGDEGWVQARWLSDQEPAQSVLLRLADEHERVKKELATLKKADRPANPLHQKLPLWTLGAVGGGGLLLGFVVGATWLDRRYRDRHGGFRL